MSSVFSIGEDQLDLDDEDCLLEACGSSMESFCNKNLASHQNKSSSNMSHLRSKDEETLRVINTRKPFESIGNVSQRSSSVMRAGFNRGSGISKVTCNDFGINVPAAKRFALDNSSPRPSLSGSLISTTCPKKNIGALCQSTFSTPSPNVAPFQATGNPLPSSPQVEGCLANQPPLTKRATQLSIQTTQHLLRTESSVTSRITTDQGNKASRISYSMANTSYGSRDLSRMHPGSSTDAQMSPVSSSLRHLQSPVNSSCVSNSMKAASTPVSWKLKNNMQFTPTASTRTKDLPECVTNTSKHTSSASSTNTCSGDTLNENFNSFGNSGFLRSVKKTVPVDNLQVQQTVTPESVRKSRTRTPVIDGTPRLRKFPGPAGLLPKLNPGQDLDEVSLASPLQVIRRISPVQTKVPSSSSSDDEDFNRDPWSQMHDDFEKSVPLTMRYTIVRVYSEAIQQRLARGKVPCLCALVKTFSLTEADASVLLKDPTGEIHGTLHRKVLEDHQTELAAGAGLVLKHVSVFSPSPRKHYLNITPGNILHIYPPDPQYVGSSQLLASQCTPPDERTRQAREKMEAIKRSITENVECNEDLSDVAVAEDYSEEMQADCFGELLQDLDDDDDLFEALLV